MTLVIEALQGGRWFEVGRLEPTDPSGSMSHNTPEGREVIIFHAHNGYSIIDRSRAGVDVELGAHGEIRALGTLAGVEELTRLTPGQTFETLIKTDRMRAAAQIRFRQE